MTQLVNFPPDHFEVPEKMGTQLNQFIWKPVTIIFLLLAMMVCVPSRGQGTPMTASDLKDKKQLLQLGYNESLIDLIYSNTDDSSRASVTEALTMVKQKKHTLKTVQLKDKTVKFIPMVHMGQKEFYEDVKSSIKKFKKQGFTVYYEGVLPGGKDSLANDTMSRKVRKAVGFSPTREMYAMLKMLVPELVPQYRSLEIGIAASDINADVTDAQFVQHYEQLYGKITLDSCDFNTSLRAMYNCEQTDKSKYEAVILDFRNEQLAEKISTATHSKILVIYGSEHVDPVIGLIKKWNNKKMFAN